jgi:hypothetical protein
LHSGEPWFLLRAQDKFSVEAVYDYALLLKNEARSLVARGGDDDCILAAKLIAQMVGFREIASEFSAWQKDNQEFVKLPD